MQILVTGASGFVGSALVQALADAGHYSIRAAVRRERLSFAAGIEGVVVGEIGPDTEWQDALSGVDVVIHTAAQAHNKDTASPDGYQRVNAQGTVHLARQAAAAGVRRFIFISTVGVHGASTALKPLTEASAIAPHTPYALSKYQAELGLREVCSSADMQWLILRCPLIYGVDAPGNFRRLLHWVAHNRPLPLAAVKNRRSLLALDNLLDLLLHCLHHPTAANRAFLVADADSIATPELVRLLALGMGHTPRLLSVPPNMLRWGLTLLGRGSMFQQLCGSLEVDATEVRRILGWCAPLSAMQALPAVAAGYSGRCLESSS